MDVIEQKQSRNSNIEVLRIVSILMIIASHSVIYGIVEASNNIEYTIWLNGSLFNKIATIMFIPGGDIGVGIFLLLQDIFVPRVLK